MAAITTQEFEHHFKSLYKPLCLFALRYTDQVDDAEDIVQQAFADVWDKNRAGNVIGNLKAYLYQAVRNRSLSFTSQPVNAEATEQLPDVEDTSEEEDILRSERDARLWDAIDRLPPERKKIFLLSKRDGLKYQEIAEELNLSVKTVENLMSKASSVLALLYGVRNAGIDKADVEYVFDCAEEACGEDGITVLDAEGQEMTFDSLTEALQEADDSVADSGIATQSTANPNLVVVRDPGHGGSDPGACKYGLREADLTLKIAQYCKSKLEEYSHVEVYMTRTADTDNNLANRVAYAKKFNPDVFVSIHINAVGGQHGGAEVYYPNGNYIPGIGTEGKELAEVIQQKLVALGLYNRGIKIRNTEDGAQYPDGSPSDYLGVIKRSKEAGFPAVLIEHAFIDNYGDVYNFLSREDKVKEMGYADATAIAEYYG